MAVELGTAATQDSSAFATAEQGLEADAAVKSVVAGSNVIVDNTDPQNPIVSASALTGYIGNPSVAPVLSSVSGGTLAAATYYVKITYENSTGETLPSPESNLAVALDNLLVVDSPSSATNATGYNVYVSTTTGTETKQNSTPISIGTNWTEPTSGLISGSALPSSNTTGTVGGTVSSVSVAAANGFLATVANPTTTPDITIKTGVTGILYGNGTGVSAAVPANFPTLTSLGAVATIAALRLYSGTAFGQTVFLQGYTAQNDGGQGPFQWGAYATDNGGTIITPTSQSAGSWYRIYNSPVISSWFGSNPILADNASALQSFINFVITSHQKGRIPIGVYSIGTPLLIMSFVGGIYNYCGCEIEGEEFSYDSVTPPALSLTQIVPTFNNLPPIMIQNGRGVKLKDIQVLGKNDFSGSYTPLINSSFVINSCRDSKYSPYAGICIDPFGTSVPSDGGYPGYSSYYVASAAGSASLEFDGVRVWGFVSGICLSPNGTIANCSEIDFNNCLIEYCKTGLSICQTQSRNVNWYAGSITTCLYCFDTNTYGLQDGSPPHIFGCNMSGKWLFNTANDAGGSLLACGIHAESFGGIGFIGPTEQKSRSPAIFSGCEINPNLDIDLYLTTNTPVIFDACTSLLTNNPPRFYSDDVNLVQFKGCSFVTASGVDFPLGLSSYFNNTLSGYEFDNCSFSDVLAPNGVSSLNQITNIPSIGTIAGNIVFPGNRIQGSKYGNYPNTGIGLSLIGGFENAYQVAIGSVTVTSGAGNIATFTYANPGTLKVGDLVYTITAMNVESYTGGTISAKILCLGQITTISGTTITINGTPQSFVTGTYTLLSQWIPRLHIPNTADTNSSTSLTNVATPTDWLVGQHISGSGIPIGTYVTAVSGTTITLSQAATATATGISIYDAWIYPQDTSNTISTPALVSGTTYQNTSFSTLTLYVPITYTPTSVAAATCAVALGTSGAPSTIFTNSRPAGSQLLDSEVVTEVIRIPPNWYYSFTVTNANIGTTAGVYSP